MHADGHRILVHLDTLTHVARVVERRADVHCEGAALHQQRMAGAMHILRRKLCG